MELGIFIKNILIILVIVTVVFLSQQPFFKTISNNATLKITEKTSDYVTKTRNWFFASIYPRVGGGVDNLQSSAKKEITEQKNNAVQIIWEKFKNYFAEKFSKTFGTEVK